MSGPLAQLVERFICNEEVIGSNPIRSTHKSRVEERESIRILFHSYTLKFFSYFNNLNDEVVVNTSEIAFCISRCPIRYEVI